MIVELFRSTLALKTSHPVKFPPSADDLSTHHGLILDYRRCQGSSSAVSFTGVFREVSTTIDSGATVEVLSLDSGATIGVIYRNVIF